GLAALAVPVLIHLFNLRRYRRVVFSNVRLLQSIVTQKARQKNILHRIVLACRILALLFLVLAFAQPSFLQKEAPKSNTEAVCIYLDNSYSMSEQHQNASMFELARQAAREIVRRHPPGTRFCFITNDPFRPLFFGNAESCKRWIDETTLFPAALNLNQIQKRFRQLLSQQPASRKHAYLISDFRKNLAEGASLTPLAEVQTQWIPISATEHPNISLDTAWLEAPVLPGDGRIRLKFQATNHSRQNLDELSVQLHTGASVLSSSTLNIPAGARISSSIEATGFKNTASIPLTLQLSDEGFPFDNKLNLSVWPSDIGKTSIRGIPDRWLQTMLRSAPVFRDTGAQTSLEISCGLRSLNTVDAKQMLDQSNAGACCVIIPHNEADPEGLNSGLRDLGFPEFRSPLSGLMLPGTPAYDHPMLREVFVKTPEDGNLGSCKHYFPTGGSRAYAEALLLFRDGNPAVLYRKTGRGCIMVFTMPWTEDNREFLNSPLPLTLLINGALRRTHTRPLYLNAGNGQYLELQGILKEGKNWNLELNGKRSIAETVPFEDKIRFYGGSSLNEAGLYRILSPEGIEAGYLALNTSRAESNPGLISNTVLEALAKSAGATLIQADNVGITNSVSKKNIRWLAAAVALFLMAEMILLA
ncbi:MAG: BatA domain-containing protein, partial [Bacteroidetes bacterium]|nr:BatA domain-containing protein [Bacteroidota bacterium]